MASYLNNPFTQYQTDGGNWPSNANSSNAPLSIFEIMTGKKPEDVNPGQVPSGPGNPNQGANWMPPQGGMGSPQSQNMPSQGVGGQQWNGFLPVVPGGGMGFGGGQPSSGQGVSKGGSVPSGKIIKT